MALQKATFVRFFYDATNFDALPRLLHYIFLRFTTMNVENVSPSSSYKRHMLLRKIPNELQHSRIRYLSFYSLVVFPRGRPQSVARDTQWREFCSPRGRQSHLPTFPAGRARPEREKTWCGSPRLPQTLSPAVFPAESSKNRPKSVLGARRFSRPSKVTPPENHRRCSSPTSST